MNNQIIVPSVCSTIAYRRRIDPAGLGAASYSRWASTGDRYNE
jgi:hypothetical protein